MKPRRSVSIAYLLPNWLQMPVLPIVVGNEIRAIFPAWLAAMLLVGAARLLGKGMDQHAVVVGYGFGCTALGSIAAGHDFTHRTLGAMLSLPFPREQLWWTRLAVSLAGMAPLLVIAAVQVFVFSQAPAPDSIMGVVILAAPVLSGLFVAPWLTLLCRSPLAGTVFTVALPFLFWMVSELGALARFGRDYNSSLETSSFKIGLFGLMLLAHWVVGAFFGWRKFMRLEAIDGRVGELRLPGWLSRTARAQHAPRPCQPGHPFGKLLKKELRLQQMALLVAGIFLLVWISLWEVHRLQPEFSSAFIDVGTLLYVGLLSLVIGSVASAEERQLGTAEWQVLMPVAAWKQWTVKVGVALGLAMLLAGLLPACVLKEVSWGTALKGSWLEETAVFAGVAAALATISLYISSACASSLMAILVSLPIGAGFLALMAEAHHGYTNLLAALRAHYGRVTFWEGLGDWPPVILLIGLLVLTLRFALVNHRFAERATGRIWRQLGCLIAYSALCAAASFNFYFAYPRDRYSYRVEIPLSATSSQTASFTVRILPGMNPELLKRYGLVPPSSPPKNSTNSTSSPK